MKISKDFTGGNIEVIKEDNNDIYVEREMRDSQNDWFYWAFSVEGAQGRTLTFHFNESRLGYLGPAISSDLKNWHWLGENEDEHYFTYSFVENENKVYFAHNMLYHPDRFYEFAKKHNLNVKELCKSKRGRSVPYFTFGSGEKSIILTARHHACESTGSYILEGVLDEIIKKPIDNTKIFCVPFVDFDGVVDGDQGKNRIPFDHNRDYGEKAIYPETAAIRDYVLKNGAHFAFDFHSPWHRGGQNDVLYIPQKTKKIDNQIKFSKIFEKTLNEKSLTYLQENDYPPNTYWNLDETESFTKFMLDQKENELAFSFETPYFGLKGNEFEEDKALETGRCFVKALKKYIEVSK